MGLRVFSKVKSWPSLFSIFQIQGRSLSLVRICERDNIIDERKGFKLHKKSLSLSTPAHSFWRKKPQHVQEIQDDPDKILHFRQVEVTTCEGIWEDVLFCRFIVGYMDSHPGQQYNANNPVIVGLHGMAKDHNDLAPLLESLVKVGYRVIIPNFPESLYTKAVKNEDYLAFSHETFARAQFVYDFLKVINIEKIEVMVGYSMGCYSTLHILANKMLYVKSLVLICPGPHYVYSIFQPYWALQFLTKWHDRPFFQFPIRLFILFLKYFKSTMRQVTLRQAIYQVRISAGVNFPEVPGNLLTVETMNLPTLMIYGFKDKTIMPDLKWMEEYSTLLGIEEEDLTEYDGRGIPIKQGQASSLRKRIVFSEGTHQLHHDDAYKKLILMELWEFLKTVKTHQTGIV